MATYAQSSAVGTWKGETANPNGTRTTVTLVVKGDGTGTFKGGAENQLSGIVIEGNSISFSFKPVRAGGALAMNMAGQVDGDTMTLRGTIGGGPANPGPPLVLAREK
jgi:hypothetical protein